MLQVRTVYVLPTKSTKKLDALLVSSIMNLLDGQIAQLVEQRIENPRVGGSIPPLATKEIKHLAQPNRWAKCFLRQALTFF